MRESLSSRLVELVATRMANGWNKHNEERRSWWDFNDEAREEINALSNLDLIDLIEMVEGLDQ